MSMEQERGGMREGWREGGREGGMSDGGRYGERRINVYGGSRNLKGSAGYCLCTTSISLAHL